MEKRRILVVIFIILGFTSLLFLSIPDKLVEIKGIDAINGKMNLEGWDMEEEKILPLNGTWEFYWDQLLTPADFLTKNTDKPNLTGYINVPGLWNGKVFEEKKLPIFGCATYRLVLENIPYHGILGLKKGNARFSSKIYVNGQELLSDGKPATNSLDYKSGNTPQIGFFSCTGTRMEILVQVANYEYINSGIPVSLEIGNEKDMVQQYQKSNMVAIAIFAILWTIALLHLIFYGAAWSGGLKEHLLPLFSLFCFLFAIGNGLADQRPLLLFLPDISFTTVFKLKDIFLAVNFIIIIWIFYKSKKGILKLNTARMISILYGIYMVGVVILPIFIYIKIYILVIICNTLILLVLLKRSLFLYIFNGEGFLLFIAILSVNMYSADAILFSFGLKSSSSFLQVYMMIFAAVMILLLSKQYYSALNDLKNSLKRTREAEIAFLRAQINPHFLFNALNSIASLCQSAPEKAEEVVVELSHYLRHSFDFIQMDGMSTLAKELELLDAYLYIEKTRFGDRLQVEYDIEEDLDLAMPPLILQPLVENAVRHGLMARITGGTVSISIKQLSGEAIFTIIDNGVGMEADKLKGLLEKDPNERGVGVRNINQRLKMLYNIELNINSDKNHGTKVTFVLPLSLKNNSTNLIK